MSRRGSYIADIDDSFKIYNTSFPKGPVHNAVRRMTELIDLEDLEGYFDEYLLESQQQQQQQKTNHQERDFDALPQRTSEPSRSSIPGRSSRPPSRFITIESYTKIRLERQQEIDVPQAKITSLKDENILSNESEDSASPAPKKHKRISASSQRVSDLEKNAWKAECAVETVNHYDKRNKSKKSIVFKIFFGINDEFKWYSLKGKGLCLILPMAVFYVVLCVTLLPFLVAAAAVSAVVVGAGVCSYLSFATKKVGVSSDDDGDKSCLEAIMWWA